MDTLGSMFILLGITDFVLWNFFEIDIYYEVGINVPLDILPYTAFIAGAIGIALKALSR